MEINAEKKNFPLSASPVPKSNFPLRERDKERERQATVGAKIFETICKT